MIMTKTLTTRWMTSWLQVNKKNDVHDFSNDDDDNNKNNKDDDDDDSNDDDSNNNN